MRERFRDEMDVLTAQLAALAERCERGVEAATSALLEGDEAAVGVAVQLEQESDRLQDDLERLCLRLLLTQQPVAGDLRLVSAAMQMSTDLERIGDQAADIAVLVDGLPDGVFPPRESALGELFAEMADLCTSMLRDAIAAYDLRDADMARCVIARDDAVDARFAAARRSVASSLHTGGEHLLDLFLCAKYYERIGDHAQNIAEWVEYALSGIYRGREM